MHIMPDYNYGIFKCMYACMFPFLLWWWWQTPFGERGGPSNSFGRWEDEIVQFGHHFRSHRRLGWEARITSSSNLSAASDKSHNDDRDGSRRSNSVLPSAKYGGVAGLSPYFRTNHPPLVASRMRAGRTLVAMPSFRHEHKRL